MNTRHSFVVALALLAPAGAALADQHTAGSPALSSRPGAAYTIYLDPAGFNYDGMWIGETPGNNLGLNNRGPTDTFTADDVTEIRAIWAAMANQYRCFNVNVTTVDPAIAAGQSATDILRRDYYDGQLGMMHTVIGPPGNNGWQGAADGLAGLFVIGSMQMTGSGRHTNWMFSQDVNLGGPVENGTYIGNISAHEGGHTFGLHHQSDYTGETNVNEYSFGDDATGDGSYVPTMGNASARQRVAWRLGSANSNGTRVDQNDVQIILSNTDKSVADSGIGHTIAAATALPVVSGSVNMASPLHRGCISPASAATPLPIGAANYTTDFFSFSSNGTSTITLTLHDGNDLLVPGTADNAATLRGVLTIRNAAGNAVGAGIEDASTLATTYTGILPAGTYYAQITSFGGHAQASAGFNAASFYDMGGYFVTGSGFGTGCAADYNLSGTVNVQDIFDFLAGWFAGAPAADFNHVNGLNVQDIFDFLSAWFAGC